MLINNYIELREMHVPRNIRSLWSKNQLAFCKIYDSAAFDRISGFATNQSNYFLVGDLFFFTLF